MIALPLKPEKPLVIRDGGERRIGGTATLYPIRTVIAANQAILATIQKAVSK